MFLKNLISTYTGNYWDNIDRLKQALANCDAVLIGAGAGLSTSAGLTYSGKRFEKHFADFHEKYGINDMYSGGFYPYESLEEYWGWWSRHIFYNRYVEVPKDTYRQLLDLIKDKDYFVLTTNVDHCFQKAGFEKDRLFYTQGDYGLWQCSVPCHDQTYDNEAIVRQMVNQQQNMRIPSELIPYCPKCRKPMTMNLRVDSSFVEDAGWHQADERYRNFLKKHGNGKILLLELGVGENTPVIIKYPFQQIALQNSLATYVCINRGEAFCPFQIADQSICIDGDIHEVLEDIKNWNHPTNKQIQDWK